jgi:hypothetical protein
MALGWSSLPQVSHCCHKQVAVQPPCMDKQQEAAAPAARQLPNLFHPACTYGARGGGAATRDAPYIYSDSAHVGHTTVFHATNAGIRNAVGFDKSLLLLGSTSHTSRFGSCNCRSVSHFQEEELTVTSGKIISRCILSLHLCCIYNALICPNWTCPQSPGAVERQVPRGSALAGQAGPAKSPS